MRCKLHPYANAVGVCAPCLRDRLVALAAERDQAAAASDDGSSSPLSLPLPARRRDHAVAARGFPRSVSPYVAHHRRSDASAAYQPSLLFFRTPQVGPAGRCAAADDEPAEAEEDGHQFRKVGTRRSFLVAIFGGRRGRHGPREEEEEEEEEEEAAGAKQKEPPRRSTSWLSAIVRRKRRPDAAAVSSHPAQPQPDEEPESPGGGTSSSSTTWWFPSPSPARQHRRGRHGAGAGASGDGISAGFAVWLSPLVRPGSASARGLRRCQPPDPSSLGDASHRRHASASFGRNTSRKLADMSRFR